MITTGSWLREMLAFPMLEATKWRLQPLLAAINLKPPALPGDTYSAEWTSGHGKVWIGMSLLLVDGKEFATQCVMLRS